jgi:transposase
LNDIDVIFQQPFPEIKSGARMNTAILVALDPSQRQQLALHLQDGASSTARHARIVALAAEGLSNHEIARQLGISRSQVIAWRRRFSLCGIAALDSASRLPGRKPRIDAAEIIRLTQQTRPTDNRGWSTRKLALHAGVSSTTVHKVWKHYGITPGELRNGG